MNNPAEKDMSENTWFAETMVHVTIDKVRQHVTCRATHFSVTENDMTYQVEIFGIQILGFAKADYAKIPVTSQKLIKARLTQNLTEKLEVVRKMKLAPVTPIQPTAA